MQALDKQKVYMEPSWDARISTEFAKEYMGHLRQFLKSEYQKGKIIFPKGSEYFTAFNLTPFEKVKVVIIGQDPYHGPQQAHGLCFSVPEGVPLPPSLVNIFKELESDLQIPRPKSGLLTNWARQGVLLLNSVLTVENGQAASHQGKGWELFTDAVIEKLNSEKQHLVFILWGASAQKKAAFVDRQKHFVIESPHPSPLSAHRGFFGSKPFSKTNEYLQSMGLQTINWSLDVTPTVGHLK